MSVGQPQLQRLLGRHLPSEIAEHLLPCIAWRLGKRRITVQLPNPVWEDCFNRYALPIIATTLQRDGRQLVVRCLGDAGMEENRQQHDARLDTVLHDPGNAFAIAACRRVVESPGIEHNPLYIHGPGGCGKSHLLSAIAREYRDMLGEASAVVMNGDAFVNHHAHQLADRQQSPLRQSLEQAALIVLDDIEALARRTLAQEELFHLLNACLENGQQVVISGRRPPQRLDHLPERLTTRLAWGLTVGIEPPLLETRIALLRRLAGPAIADLNPASIPALVESRCPDLHPVTALAQTIAQGDELDGTVGTSFDRILSVVSEHSGLRAGDLVGKSRARAITRARQTALLLARRLTDHNLESLGALVGGRDHSTVIYSLRQAEDRLRQDPAFVEEVRLLTQRILDADRPE